MPTPMPLTLHEELALLDEIEQAMLKLTTADLERCDNVVAAATPAEVVAAPPKTGLRWHSPE